MPAQHWPFFQSLVDLIEMVLSKADMRIAALYDTVLVGDGQVRCCSAHSAAQQLCLFD